MDMPMGPADPLTITLQAIEWNLVMDALQDAPLPYRRSSIVISKIAQQFQNRPGNSEAALARFQENMPRRPAA